VAIAAALTGIEVAMKREGEEVVLPAIAILHQALFGEESVTERIVLGILDLDSGEISAVERENVAGVSTPWFDDDSDDDYPR
jgi:hypothetical protein